MKKDFESVFKKIKHKDKDFSSHQRDWGNFEQNNESIALSLLKYYFYHKIVRKITLVYKSEHNLERGNKVLLLMINDDDDAEKYHYFAVKSKLELNSSEWLRSKKESITNENALNDSLDYQWIKKDPQKISKLKPYINQYNLKDIEFPSDKEDWKMFEQNNKEIALNILFVRHNKRGIELAYISKYNYKRKKQVILLMITDDGKRWHYLTVKSLLALPRGISSSNNGDFYCLNCFNSYRTLNKLEKHERVCNNHDYCHVDMPKEHEKIKYLPGEKSLKAPFIICADLECLLKKRNIVKIILKILTQRKKLSTNLQDTHGVQYAHLMIQKTNAIFIGEKIVLKSFVKI